MEKLLVLELDGSFEQGVRAKLEIRQEIHSRPQTIVRGQLPANQELLETYRQWQRGYSSLEIFFRKLTDSAPEQVTNSSGEKDAMAACQETASLVEDNLNRWLNYSEEFEPIREALPSRSEQFRLWIQTDNVWLKRFPWEKWNKLQNAELAIVVSEYDISARKHRPNEKIKVLAILGYATDLKNLPKDKQLLDEIAGKAGAEIVWRQEPSPQELNQMLRQGNWDILFFSGHSASTEDGKRCEIQLTESHKLEIPDFRFALRDAVEKGLSLAIFNSCDGIGLAYQLAAEKGIALPHLIFMREKLPDPVSPKFLQHFLEAFTLGKSLYTSVHEAQKILHDDWEQEYPCASWLPVVCPNPTEEPPTWDSLSKDILIKKSRRILRTALTISLAVATLVVGVRELGGLEFLELAAYDQMMQMRPEESMDDRLLVITIDEVDFDYQDKNGMKRAEYQDEEGKKHKRSLAGEALSKLLTRLEPHKPAAIGLDVLRDISSTQDYPPLGKQLEQTKNLFVICKGQDKNNPLKDTGVAPPPELAIYQNRNFSLENRIGYSDVLDDSDGEDSDGEDSDGIVRRFLWSANFGENSPCLPHQTASQPAFSLLLAQHYLQQQENIQLEPKKLSKGIWETNTNKAQLTAWHSSVGGAYRHKEQEKGYQMMLNYRNVPKSIARTVPLSDVLNEQSNFQPKSVKDKIVLIGVTADGQDEFLFPLGNDNETMKGVFIHAHMISQILSAVLNKRPLISTWHPLGEIGWIVCWALVGGVLVWCFQKSKYIILAEGAAIFVLSGACYLLFLQGWWVPYVPPMLVIVGTGGVVFIYRMLMPSGKLFPKAATYTQRR